MDVKEKLVELLGANTCKHDCCEDCEHCEIEDACTAHLKDSMAEVTHWMHLPQPPKGE